MCRRALSLADAVVIEIQRNYNDSEVQMVSRTLSFLGMVLVGSVCSA